MFAKALALIAAASLATACREDPQPPASAKQAVERGSVGLMTTLPLLWGEAADVGELLAAKGGSGWVRQEVEARFVIEPLDTLEPAALARLDRLVLAQPRPLAPQENVALDAWVRDGGRLLLFADPILTRHSRFPIGDRRRPQDAVLLSPILAHWGLELMFDEAQSEGERRHEILGTDVPLNMAGSFRFRAGAPCEAVSGAVVARCRIGKGQVVALADAAVLDDPEGGDLETRRVALGRLLGMAFE